MMLCWNSNVTSVGFAEFAAYPIAIPITAKNNNIIKIFLFFYSFFYPSLLLFCFYKIFSFIIMTFLLFY